MKLCIRLILCSSFALLPACKTTEGSKTKDTELSRRDDSAQARVALDRLRLKYNNYPLQDDPSVPDDCGSFYMPPAEGVAFSGTAVLFHGFTACPQQYYEMATILAKKGVATFVPLLPGMGRSPAPDSTTGPKVGEQTVNEYYGQFLPRIQNDEWKRYLDFVADVSQFMKTIPGDKFIAGVSVGGNLATYSYLESPGLYKRVLLSSPYYGMPSSYPLRKTPDGKVASPAQQIAADSAYHITDELIKTLARDITAVGSFPIGWGEVCHRQQSNGRRGICHFRVENLAAVNALGGYVLEQLKNPSRNAAPDTTIHYVPVEFDTGADTTSIRRALAYQQKGEGAKRVSSCWYPTAYTHSYFSRRDLSELSETPWVASFLSQASNFLAYGDKFATSGASEERVFDAASQLDTSKFLSRCSVFPLTDAEITTRR